MQNTKPLVSVITPVFNTEEYLSQCIESVLNQTYDNWQYTIVNNGSTDKSLEIAESYSRQDSRIKVTSNEGFLGQIDNYNNAVRQIPAEAKYCKIVQADDWIFPECLEEMVRVAEANPTVGIVGSYVLVGSSVYLSGLPYPSTAVRGSKICRLLLLNGLYLFGTPNSLLFRGDLIRSRDPFFEPADGYFEDADACLDLLRETDFGFVHQVLSFTRRDNESIQSSIRHCNPFLLMEVYFLVRKGRYYLTEEEMRERLRKKAREYFLFLGESVLRNRGKRFWSYHVNGLQKINWRISRWRLAWYSFLSFLDLALNPKSTIERLIKLHRRNQANQR